MCQVYVLLINSRAARCSAAEQEPQTVTIMTDAPCTSSAALIKYKESGSVDGYALQEEGEGRGGDRSVISSGRCPREGKKIPSLRNQGPHYFQTAEKYRSACSANQPDGEKYRFFM